MPVKLENEKTIREFLFGELPEQKRFEFEERFITDADFFEEIKIVEDELIEKYVRGWLNPAERLKFEQNFLTTAKRRERVEFSQHFINTIQNNKPEIVVAKKTAEAVSEKSVWQKIAGFFVMPKIAVATAFAVLIAIFGSWFLYRNFNETQTEIVRDTNSNIKETPTPRIPPVAMPDNSLNEQKDSSDENDDDDSSVDKVPEKTPKITKRKIEKTPTPQQTPKITRKPAPNPVLALFAGTMRSEGKNNVLNLPENSKGAVLQINLENVEYENYQAELTDADGNVIFRKDRLKVKKSKINLFIPADKLQKGDYIIKLYGENQTVADFQFRVK